MNQELLWVLGLLAIVILLFVINRPRMDVVALLVILALPLLGILTVEQALAGFSDPTVVLIAALLLVAGCHHHHYRDDDGGWRDGDRGHRHHQRHDRDDDDRRYRDRDYR